MTTKWDELTEEEREEYVNQDIPYMQDQSQEYVEIKATHWREIMQVENPKAYKMAAETSPLSDAIINDPIVELCVVADDRLTPFGRVIFHEFFINRRSARVVAKSMSIVYQVDGEDQEVKGVTIDMVRGEIGRIRKKLKAEIGLIEQLQKNLELTQERLKLVMDYNSDTGVFTWNIDRGGDIKKGEKVGWNSLGYLYVELFGKKYGLHRLAWLYEYGELPCVEIDHINRKRDDNRIINLRLASRSENLHNTGNHNDNKSGVKGVHWDKTGKKWAAKIGVNGKQRHLGSYEDFNEAVCTRLAAEQCAGLDKCGMCSPAHLYVKNSQMVHKPL